MTSAVANHDAPNAGDSFCLHWPEYLMEGGESALSLFSGCALSTLSWHAASPVQRYLPDDTARRIWMGVAIGATIFAVFPSSWSKPSGAPFRPAVTFTFDRLGKVALGDTAFYCAVQFFRATAGVAMASFVLQGTPAHDALHYAATIPGVHDANIAFLAAARVFPVAHTRERPNCAKLHHDIGRRLFRHSGPRPAVLKTTSDAVQWGKERCR